MQRFVVDDDRLLVSDGETLEYFWRGVSPGSQKWRFHLVHAAAEMSLNRKGDEVAVKVGDRYSGATSVDVAFEIPVARSDELVQFFHAVGIQPT
ncbi:MAG: hypothetical protein JWL72_3330 [Ilumatobacteraceae bacterium]|nr:hypothetical protein [Ilumatobacteraceae bacterium]MCU1389992.1 hypothetical protein [Ilumatobacteraceae bacterium]